MTGPAGEPAPVKVRSHRAPPDRLARFGSRLGVGTLIIAALAMGGPLAALRPDNAVRERPYLRAGRVGELVPVRTFDAAVLSVRGAAKISQGGGRHDTGGVWILVRVRLVVRDETTTIRYAALRDQRGRSFVQSARIDQPLTDGARELQPGVPVEGEIAFEVPRDAVAQLSLRLARTDPDHRMDAMAEVPLLPVDSATVDRWLADPTPAAVAQPKVVPR
jgi:hypothetical protein